MGETYATAIHNTACIDPYFTQFSSRWSILQPPTGTGKSQGAALYAAMLALANDGADLPTYTLIVVRQKKQCEEIAATVHAYIEAHSDIDPHSLCDYHHTDHFLTPNQRRMVPVLIVTHSAFVNAITATHITKDRYNSISMFGALADTRRYLTIIDESLGSVVETSQVTHDVLLLILACIGPTDRLRRTHKAEVECIKTMIAILELALQDDMATPDTVYRDLDRHFKKLPDPDTLDFTGFRKQFRKKDIPAHLNQGKTTPEDRRRLSRIFAETFDSIQVCLSQWRYYAKEQFKASINTSSFVIPDNLVAPVCLDATASNNYLWELLGPSSAEIVKTPAGARNYKGVTFNMALEAGQRGLGKGTMRQHASKRASRLIGHLNKKITGDTLIVCHKDVEPALIKYLCIDDNAPLVDGLPEWYLLPNGSKVYLNHWWALDGLNSYQHCENVVIFGLPYMDDVWALNMIFALRGYKPDMLRNGFTSNAEYRKHLEHQQMTLMIIQAVNRVRCRRVTTSDGGCAPTNVWVILPALDDGSGYSKPRPEAASIIAGVKADMPYIKIAPWHYKIDEAKDRMTQKWDKKTTAPFALIVYMSNRNVGTFTYSSIAKRLNLSPRQTKRLRDQLGKEFKAQAGNLFEALRDRGVEYIASQGKAAVLVKTDS